MAAFYAVLINFIKGAYYMREELTKSIMEKYDQLNDENKAKFREFVNKLYQERQDQQCEQLKQLLRKQCMNWDDFSLLSEYIQRQQSTGEYNEGNTCLLYLDAFSYGIICGKRAERARRKVAHHE